MVVYDLATECWIDAEVIRTAPIKGIRKFESHRRRANTIQSRIKMFANNYEPQLALVECWKMTGVNSKSAAAMSVAWAVVVATLDTMEVSQIHIQPEDGKEACCGSRSASKDDVADYLVGRWLHLGRLARDASVNATKNGTASVAHAEHIFDAAALYVAASNGEHSDQIRLLKSLIGRK